MAVMDKGKPSPTPHGEGAKPEWLEQYEKGVADGIESAALLCEKAYGYMTPQDLARRIRALAKEKQS